MPVDSTAVQRHLTRLFQQRSLDAALEFFDALGYQYADELPLPTRTWPDGIQRLLKENADPPIYLATHRDFQVIFTRLATEHLARTVERPIVEQTLHKLHPYALFLFTNQDRSEWDFVNVKYAAEDGDRRRTIRRIHVSQAERLHTAAQRLAMLAVPTPDTSALEIQSRHDQAFDVEEVTRQFYRDYVDVFGKLCDDIARRNPHHKREAEAEAQLLLDRLMFLYFIQKKGWLDGQRDYLYRNLQTCCQADPSGTTFYSDFLLPLFAALSNEGLASPRLGDVPFLNGGLFEVPADTPLAGQLVLGDGVFKQVFDDLLERYNFTVREDTPLDVEVAIDPEMLGQVFENLVLGLERGEDRRKATGSFYTPRVIVHFMCRQALKEYLAAESGIAPDHIGALMEIGPAEQLAPEEVAQLHAMITEPEARLLRGLIETLRALDLAVGSGAFLVGMLYEMVALTKLLDVRLYGQARVRRRNYDYDLKRGFIERNLYGVDIQPEAVRICELRLWLSLMVEYERQPGEVVPTLPNLSYRVRVGDSLIERLFGEPVQLDELADDAVARQLIDRIQAEKQAYFQEPGLWEKQRRELHILGLLCELAAKLIGAKRSAVLTQMTAQVPQMGDAFLSGEQRKLKEAFDAELERYDGLLARAKDVYDRVQAMQDGRAHMEARDVGALREELGLSFIWRLDFAEVFADRGGFDIVIANPPYVTFSRVTGSGRRDRSKDEEQKKLLESLYPSSAEYKISTYAVFMDKGIALLQATGAMCYVVPDSFLVGRYFSKLRDLILRTCRIKKLVLFAKDFWEHGVVGLPVITALGRETQAPKRDSNELTAIRADTLQAFEEQTIQQHRYEQHYFRTVRFDRFRLFFRSEDMLFVRQMENNAIPAGDLVSMHVGIRPKVGYAKIQAGEKRGLDWYPGLVKGSEVTRFAVNWGGNYIHVSPNLLWGGGFHQDIVTQPKLLMRKTGNEMIVGFDRSGFYHLDILHAIVLRNPAYDLRYIMGLFNSRVMNRYYELITLSYNRVMAQTNIETILQLPICPIDFNDSADVSRHNRMVSLADRMQVLCTELSSGSAVRHPDAERQIAATDAEIDALVCELYGLTDEEIAIVEGRG